MDHLKSTALVPIYRLFNEPIIDGVKSVNKSCGSPLNDKVATFFGDLLGNICGSSLSMPLHLAFCFIQTSPHLWQKSQAEQMAACKQFIVGECFRGNSVIFFGVKNVIADEQRRTFHQK